MYAESETLTGSSTQIPQAHRPTAILVGGKEREDREERKENDALRALRPLRSVRW